MNKHPLSEQFQQIVGTWQYFAPSLGASISLYDSKYGEWNAAIGYRQINPCQPLKLEEHFYIYSITKTFTSVAVLRLLEDGFVWLDAPVNHFLDSLNLPDGVTIKRLLNHTSGVPSYTDLPDYESACRKNPSQPWPFDYVIERTCSGKLDFEPGEDCHYSNTGYMLLLLLIEKLTGESFAEAIKKLVINKAALSNTYVAEQVDQGKLTNGYCRQLNDAEKLENISKIYNPWWCKTGLIASTSTNITCFYQRLFAGEILSHKTLSLMLEPISTGHPASRFFVNPCYGLGIMIDPKNPHGSMYGHGGDGPGFNTWSAIYPDFSPKNNHLSEKRCIGVSIFCNTSLAGHPFYLVKDLLDVIE